MVRADETGVLFIFIDLSFCHLIILPFFHFFSALNSFFLHSLPSFLHSFFPSYSFSPFLSTLLTIPHSPLFFHSFLHSSQFITHTLFSTTHSQVLHQQGMRSPHDPSNSLQAGSGKGAHLVGSNRELRYTISCFILHGLIFVLALVFVFVVVLYVFYFRFVLFS